MTYEQYRELHGHTDISTTMTSTEILKRDCKAVLSPLDRM